MNRTDPEAASLNGASRPPSRGAPGRRALLMKLGSIGDVLMVIPGAALLHAEGYAIDWVVSDGIAPVLDLYPWIRTLPVSEAGLLRSGPAQRTRAMLALWKRLRGETSRAGKYDLVATLYYDPRYRMLSLPVAARKRLSLQRDDRRFELLAGRHHADEYARILLGRQDGEMPVQVAPVRPPALPPSPLPLPPEGRNRIILVPAGARNLLRDDALRRWPIDHYVELAGQLLQRGFEVVLTGGPEDRWASAHFQQLRASLPVGGMRMLHDRIGLDSLLSTLGLLESAAVTVTHDTGPLHLAGLTSTAIVTLFGPTDPHGRLPHRADSLAIWGGEGFGCRPCYDGRAYAPCTHNGCLHQVSPEMVATQIDRLLEARLAGRRMAPQVLPPSLAALPFRTISGAA